MHDTSGQGERHGDPLRHRSQFHEAPRLLDEDADRDGLDVDGAQRDDVVVYSLEHRSLMWWARREVLVERHRRRALVRLARASEPPATRRAHPSGHGPILARPPAHPGMSAAASWRSWSTGTVSAESVIAEMATWSAPASRCAATCAAIASTVPQGTRASTSRSARPVISSSVKPMRRKLRM